MTNKTVQEILDKQFVIVFNENIFDNEDELGGYIQGFLAAKGETRIPPFIFMESEGSFVVGEIRYKNIRQFVEAHE